MNHRDIARRSRYPSARMTRFNAKGAESAEKYGAGYFPSVSAPSLRPLRFKNRFRQQRNREIALQRPENPQLADGLRVAVNAEPQHRDGAAGEPLTGDGTDLPCYRFFTQGRGGS